MMPAMKRPGEKPKNLTDLIDRLDQIREELLKIQRQLEKLENGKNSDGVGGNLAGPRDSPPRFPSGVEIRRGCLKNSLSEKLCVRKLYKGRSCVGWTLCLIPPRDYSRVRLTLCHAL
jgi:hypothetical protein